MVKSFMLYHKLALISEKVIWAEFWWAPSPLTKTWIQHDTTPLLLVKHRRICWVRWVKSISVFCGFVSSSDADLHWLWDDLGLWGCVEHGYKLILTSLLVSMGISTFTSKELVIFCRVFGRLAMELPAAAYFGETRDSTSGFFMMESHEQCS